MKNMLQKVRKNKKGFTLVELIVCLVIMAVLAAVAIPTMLGYVNKAKETADSYECRTVLMAAQTICSQQAAAKNTAFKPGTGATEISISTSNAVFADIQTLAEAKNPPTVLKVVAAADGDEYFGKVSEITFTSSNAKTWYYYDGVWSLTAKSAT